MKMNLNITKLFYFLCFLLLNTNKSCIEAKPVPGKKLAFLGGALAGAAISKVMSNHNNNNNNNHNQQQQVEKTQHVTTIEKGPVMANGCYQQTTREPDARDPKNYIETVQLICPPSNSLPVSWQMNLGNQQQVPNVVQQQSQPVPQLQVPLASIQQQQPFVIPEQHSVQQPSLVSPSVPIQQQQQQQQQGHSASETPQVFVISQKTGRYEKPKAKSHANHTTTRNPFLLLISIIFLIAVAM